MPKKTIHAQMQTEKKRARNLRSPATYKAPKTGNAGVNFKTLQKLVARYNSQRRAVMARYQKKGYTEEQLINSGVLDPRIKGGATALVKTMRSDEDLAYEIDLLNNKVKRKNKASRADVYTKRLEKKTGVKSTRQPPQLPRSADEMVRWRFHRALWDGTSIHRSLINELVGEYDLKTGKLVKEGTLSTYQITTFFLDEPSVIKDMFLVYKPKDDSFHERTGISGRIMKAMKKKGYITAEQSAMYD